MWEIDTRWFDVAVVMSIFAIGGVSFGKFEQHKPRGRRVLKQILVTGVVILIASTLGRAWAYGLIGAMGLAAAVVHLWWLPKNGINGWTAEPYDKYLELIRAKRG